MKSSFKVAVQRSSQSSWGGGRGANKGAVRAEGLPGLRGHDHTGVTVPDMAAGRCSFFVGVLGLREGDCRSGPFRRRQGHVHAGTCSTSIPRLPGDQPDHDDPLRLRVEPSSLFQYTAPDQANATPKNSDIGGYHIALYVDDHQGGEGLSRRPRA